VKNRFILFLLLVLTGLLGAAIACSGTSSVTPFTTTGILIRAETLTTGRGCGKDPANLFKYAVYVWGYGGAGSLEDEKSFTQLQTSNLFDCFTDGAFIELKPVNGSLKYRLDVYAYNSDAFGNSQTAIVNAGDNPALLESTSNPTWTTSCFATQQQDVEALAVCRPLATGLTGLGKQQGATSIRLGTSQFRLPDGRLALCNGDAGTPPPIPDAGADADAAVTDAGDAGDAAVDAEAGVVPDAGLAGEVSFSVARIRYRLGNNVSGTTDVTCPGEYSVTVPNEPARYVLDVGLTNAAGAVVGQTACSVPTLPGQTAVVQADRCGAQ